MNELQEILEHIDVESYLDTHGVDYIRTRGRSGVQLNIKTCPVCGNDQRKVYINADTGLGNCFAGSHPPDQKFNKWSLIAALQPEMTKRQLFEHIKAIAEGRSWLPKRKTEKVDEKPTLLLPESVELPYNGRNIKYLSKRGITNEMCSYFHLRFCHEGSFPYKLDGEWKRQDFSQRVLIPVFDLDGKMVTFQGRDITDAHPKKYQFPPGLAATGSHLFNGMNVRDTKRIVIGEGAFDVIALKAALDEDPSLRDVIPVGTFGKHLSIGQGDTQEAKFRELYARGVREATFMWDGEIAATDAAVKAGAFLKSLGFTVRIGLLPKDRDPNEVDAATVRSTYFKAIPLTSVSSVQIVMQRRLLNSH